MYPDYLVHFNKLHSKKNGQFVSGDGDSDGIADEHHRYSKNGVVEKWSGDRVRSIKIDSKNVKKNYKISRKMRDDLEKAHNSSKPGKHYTEVANKTAAANKKAEEMAWKEFNSRKAKGEKLDEYDYEDIFDKFISNLSPTGRDYTVAALLDLGYSERDAKDVDEFLSRFGQTAGTPKGYGYR